MTFRQLLRGEFLVVMVTIAVCTTGLGQASDEVDDLPREIQQVYVKLHGGGFTAYATVIDSPQPFETSDGTVFLPLKLLMYVLGDTSDISRVPGSYSSLGFGTGSTRVRLERGFSEAGKLTVGNAEYRLESLWLEEDVYVPAVVFLESLSVNTLWDPVLKTLAIPNARPLLTTRFAYNMVTVYKGNFPASGTPTSVITPINIEIGDDEPLEHFLTLTVRSLLDIPVGINFRGTDGQPYGSGQKFATCYAEECTVKLYLGNIVNRDDTGIVTYELVSPPKD